MATTLEQICVNTYTTTDLHRRLGLFQECLEEVLYHKDTESVMKSGIAYAKKVGSEEDAKALSEWGRGIWELFQAHNLAEHISVLKYDGEMLPTLTLYVPVAFDNEAVSIIGSWCRKNINTLILLEIIIDPEVTGGCSFVFNDSYHDFSLHNAMKNNKGIVNTLLTSYA
jgi:hypothetical protein